MLRRGWAGHEDAADAGFTDSTLVLRRPRPDDDGTALLLVHRGHDHGGSRIEGAGIHYAFERGGEVTPLADVAWADWDAAGRLLIATLDGWLRIAAVTPDAVEAESCHDLSELHPEPALAPDWARRW